MRCKACDNIIEFKGKKRIFDKETLEYQESFGEEDLCSSCLNHIESHYNEYDYSPEEREAELKRYCQESPIGTENWNWYGVLDNYEREVYTSRADGEDQRIKTNE